MKTKTDKVELVETHNLAISLARLQSSSPSYDSHRWRRALYHAAGMNGLGHGQMEKLRIALELP